MRKGLLMAVVCCCWWQIALAQIWAVGVKSGLTIPNLRSPDDPGTLNSGYHSILGFEGGLVVERQLSEKLAIQAELLYTTAGGLRDGTQRLKGTAFKEIHNFAFPGTPLPDYLYASFESKVVLKYLHFPVMLKYRVPLFNDFNVEVMGGPFVSNLLSAKNFIKGQGKIYRDPQLTNEYLPVVITVDADSTITPLCNDFNYGIQGALAISYRLENWEFSLMGGGNYGLGYLQRDEKFGKNQTGAVTSSFAIIRRF